MSDIVIEHPRWHSQDEVNELHLRHIEAVTRLSTRIEQLERENAELRSELASARSQARREALDDAIAMIKARMNSDSQAHDFATIDAIRRLAEQEGTE